MWILRRTARRAAQPDAAVDRVRAKYASFRELLAFNNESLELMAALQDDLQYVPPYREVLDGRLETLFQRIRSVVAALERLTGICQRVLSAALAAQQSEIERYCAALNERATPRVCAWISELDGSAEKEAGSKAAVLGEIGNRLGLPVPHGFVITTSAYREFCGVPLWKAIRDACRDLDLNDLEAIRRASDALTWRVMETPLPSLTEGAITTGAADALLRGGALAVRSSAFGEGGARSYAGQFRSLLNISAEQAVEAYRAVIGGRFSERALSYRLSTGMREVDTPIAALFLKMIPARASGIMYTRDPSDAKSRLLWITATRGLGVGIASGRTPADLFMVSRAKPYAITERHVIRKETEIVPAPAGGIATVPLPSDAQEEPSVPEVHLRVLADWGVRLEEHFRAPQDVEWVLDPNGALWIVQSRPLVNAAGASGKARVRVKSDPKVAGGRTVCPGQTSGKAFLVDEIQNIGDVPAGAIVFIRKPSPEIVQIFPRIAGLVAEWGNIAGHAAALLREFQIPSVFQMTGVFERLTSGEAVSLDAVQARVYTGTLWPARRTELSVAERYRAHAGDPVSARLLTLNLLDPSADNFRPAGCQTGHDVLRYCHEKAIQTMFEVNDHELEHSASSSRKLRTPLPFNLSVIDLGGGMAPADPAERHVTPEQIVSRPFQALWRGISHPEVTWTREMPAKLGDLVSVLASSLTPQAHVIRPLGEKSYLLVADEYMNLNARLAYHYSLVDACLSDEPGDNYISFRFEGGGSVRNRRSLRARFVEQCLIHHGFRVDRRNDLVNAWFRKAPPAQTGDRLDVLGRLMACSNQLDMYMNSHEVMNWYAEQFILGNYAFHPHSS